jgi:hypothetical protein
MKRYLTLIAPLLLSGCAMTAEEMQSLTGSLQGLDQSAQAWQQSAQQGQQYVAPQVSPLGSPGSITNTPDGDALLGSNGVTYRRVGNSIMGSDGTTCQVAGQQLICR